MMLTVSLQCILTISNVLRTLSNVAIGDTGIPQFYAEHGAGLRTRGNKPGCGANQINPNDDDFTTVGASGTAIQGGKGKNKKRGKAKGKTQDASHLLGFSVQSNRINAGELDVPQ